MDDVIPKPLDVALDKLWGFCSEYGRHLNEGKAPAFEEAQLVVGICASIITYLQSKYHPIDSILDDKNSDIPF